MRRELPVPTTSRLKASSTRAKPAGCQQRTQAKLRNPKTDSCRHREVPRHQTQTPAHPRPDASSANSWLWAPSDVMKERAC
jgi:hypothetical protein